MRIAEKRHRQTEVKDEKDEEEEDDGLLLRAVDDESVRPTFSPSRVRPEVEGEAENEEEEKISSVDSGPSEGEEGELFERAGFHFPSSSKEVPQNPEHDKEEEEDTGVLLKEGEEGDVVEEEENVVPAAAAGVDSIGQDVEEDEEDEEDGDRILTGEEGGVGAGGKGNNRLENGDCDPLGLICWCNEGFKLERRDGRKGEQVCTPFKGVVEASEPQLPPPGDDQVVEARPATEEPVAATSPTTTTTTTSTPPPPQFPPGETEEVEDVKPKEKPKPGEKIVFAEPPFSCP